MLNRRNYAMKFWGSRRTVRSVSLSGKKSSDNQLESSSGFLLSRLSSWRFTRQVQCALGGLMVVFLAGCATSPTQKAFPPPVDYVPIDKVQITSRFDTVEVTPANLAIEARKCVPQLGADSQGIKKTIQEFPSRASVGLGHASSANLFLLNQTTAICLQRSSAKFPIFAAEAFIDTINPQGVPPDVVDDWYKQIALQIATKGMAKVAYAFDNGNAFIATYWVEMNQSIALSYSNIFKKAGAWETEKIDFKFTHPTLTSVSEVKRSRLSQKAQPLMHRRG